MSIPIVVEISLSLIFIYLVLSLLASEIQELIATVLQWRAVHLKESIEGLLSGNSADRFDEARALANQIYDHPAIQGLNQEAKGILARLPRLLTQIWPWRVFGSRKSGPSYIASETFASSLVDTLGLRKLVQRVNAIRLKSSLEQVLGSVDYQAIEVQVRNAIRAYDNGRMTLDEVVAVTGAELKKSNPVKFDAVFGAAGLDPQRSKELAGQLGIYLVDILEAAYVYSSLSWRAQLCRRVIAAIDGNPKQPAPRDLGTALRQLQSWTDLPRQTRKTLAIVGLAWGQKNGEIDIQSIRDRDPAELKAYGLHPDDLRLVPQAELFYKSFFAYETVRNSIVGQTTIESVEGTLRSLRDQPEVSDLFADTLDQTLSVLSMILVYPDVRSLVEKMPLSALEGIQSPVRRLQLNLDNVAIQMEQLQGEIAHWMDRSMDRASGVYKRNAKLVAFLIGLTMAIASNADTFEMVDQLAKEPTLRSSIASLVEKLPVDQAFDEKGRLNSKLAQELEQSYPVLPMGWTEASRRELAQATDPRRIETLTVYVKHILGWGLTGMAISMGAAFWYDILGKFMNIKNVGKRSAEAPTNQTGNNASRA
jgi:hypothetical protein